MPDDYLKGFTEVQAKRALKEMARIDENIKHRQRIAMTYDQHLNQLGISPPYIPDYAMHTYTKYPLLVKDPEYIFSEAEKANLPIHDWFTTPLYPVSENLEQWQFDEFQFPIAVKISQHVINLPTDLSVTDKMATTVVEFLSVNKSQLMDTDDLFS